MGQPTPPGDMPLYEGLGADWNDIVGAFPEDQRAELAPKLKERISAYETQLQSYKPWDDLQKSGVTPEHASSALQIFSTIENNPREVYETIGKYLNITPAQAKEVVKEVQQGDDEDPRIVKMQQQLDTMAQVMIAQRQQTTQEEMAAQQDAAIEKELTELKKKHGDDVPEDEILMRMLHKNMTAEQAFEEYSSRVSQIRSTRPSPMIMGSGGTVPSRRIDVTKLDNVQAKNLVTQMLEHGNNEAKK